MLIPLPSAVALLLGLLLTNAGAQNVRLVGGADQRQGRLEVYHSNRWGTVCDHGFTDTEANVVCYILGYGRFGQYVGQRYGAGSGTIWLDDVRCSGTETRIADCRHRDWGSHNCGHDEDVSVSCPSVRLVGGPSPREGRLKVYHNRRWGTVCSHYFDNSAAEVVCYMLEYGRAGQAIGYRYGAGSGMIWLDDVQCNGTETNIADCQHRGWGVHNCGHGLDVSVSCPSVKLVEGSSPREGRLEVHYNST